jgi:hypothetical protein
MKKIVKIPLKTKENPDKDKEKHHNRQFRDLRSIRRAMSDVFNRYNNNEISTSQATTLITILKAILSADSMQWERSMIETEDMLEAKKQLYND